MPESEFKFPDDKGKGGNPIKPYTGVPPPKQLLTSAEEIRAHLWAAKQELLDFIMGPIIHCRMRWPYC